MRILHIIAVIMLTAGCTAIDRVVEEIPPLVDKYCSELSPVVRLEGRAKINAALAETDGNKISVDCVRDH